MKKRAIVMALGAILALMVAAPMAFAQATPPNQDLGELSARWWQWALKNPTQTNPLVGSYEGGAQCAGGSVAKVWFLAGSFTGEDVTRSCHVPANTQIFFPIVNGECSQAEGNGTTEAELRGCITPLIDLVLEDSTVFATVDGQSVLGHSRRVDSPLFRWHVPKNNVFQVIGVDIPPGQSIAVADGLYVLLPPLEPGKHTIHFGGSFLDGSFTQDNTYHLTVAGAQK